MELPMNRTKIGLALSCTAMALLLACGGDTGATDTGATDTRATDAGAMDTGVVGCSVDSDCLAGDVCDTSSGSCVTPFFCASNDDCGGDTCDTATGTCVPCHSCACENDATAGGCADECAGDFCTGAPAGPQCGDCLASRCSADIDPESPRACH
jgi:hypothetical protein